MLPRAVLLQKGSERQVLDKHEMTLSSSQAWQELYARDGQKQLKSNRFELKIWTTAHCRSWG